MKIELITILNYVVVILATAVVVILLFFWYRRSFVKTQGNIKRVHHESYTAKQDQIAAATSRTVPIKRNDAFNRIDKKLATEVDMLQKNKPNALFSIIERKLSDKK